MRRLALLVILGLASCVDFAPVGSEHSVACADGLCPDGSTCVNGTLCLSNSIEVASELAPVIESFAFEPLNGSAQTVFRLSLVVAGRQGAPPILEVDGKTFSAPLLGSETEILFSGAGLSEGDLAASLTLTDRFGQTQTLPLPSGISIDLGAPSLEAADLPGPIGPNDSVLVEASFSEDLVSGTSASLGEVLLGVVEPSPRARQVQIAGNEIEHGTWPLTFQVSDLVGNQASILVGNIEVDRKAPVLVDSRVDPEEVAAERLVLVRIATDEPMAAGANLIARQGDRSFEFESEMPNGEIQVFSHRASATEDGAWTLTLENVADLFGNQEETIELPTNLVIDGFGPDLSELDLNGFHFSANPGFSLIEVSGPVQAHELLATLDGIPFDECALETDSVFCSVDVMLHPEFLEGQRTVEVTATDEAGNRTVRSFAPFLDFSPPVLPEGSLYAQTQPKNPPVTGNYPHLNGGGIVRLIFSLDESVSEISVESELGAFTQSGSSQLPFVFEFTVSESLEYSGPIPVQIQATDEVGNGMNLAVDPQVQIDTETPEPPTDLVANLLYQRFPFGGRPGDTERATVSALPGDFAGRHLVVLATEAVDGLNVLGASQRDQDAPIEIGRAERQDVFLAEIDLAGNLSQPVAVTQHRLFEHFGREQFDNRVSWTGWFQPRRFQVDAEDADLAVEEDGSGMQVEPLAGFREMTTLRPAFLSQSASTYDADYASVLIHGGYTGGFISLPSTTTYRFSEGRWSAQSVGGPGGRTRGEMVFDPVRGGSWLFGGACGDLASTSCPRDVTWQLVNNDWTERRDVDEQPQFYATAVSAVNPLDGRIYSLASVEGDGDAQQLFSFDGRNWKPHEVLTYAARSLFFHPQWRTLGAVGRCDADIEDPPPCVRVSRRLPDAWEVVDELILDDTPSRLNTSGIYDEDADVVRVTAGDAMMLLNEDNVLSFIGEATESVEKSFREANSGDYWALRSWDSLTGWGTDGQVSPGWSGGPTNDALTNNVVYDTVLNRVLAARDGVIWFWSLGQFSWEQIAVGDFQLLAHDEENDRTYAADLDGGLFEVVGNTVIEICAEPCGLDVGAKVFDLFVLNSELFAAGTDSGIWHWADTEWELVCSSGDCPITAGFTETWQGSQVSLVFSAQDFDLVAFDGLASSIVAPDILRQSAPALLFSSTVDSALYLMGGLSLAIQVPTELHRLEEGQASIVDYARPAWPGRRPEFFLGSPAVDREHKQVHFAGVRDGILQDEAFYWIFDENDHHAAITAHLDFEDRMPEKGVVDCLTLHSVLRSPNGSSTTLMAWEWGRWREIETRVLSTGFENWTAQWCPVYPALHHQRATFAFRTAGEVELDHARVEIDYHLVE